MRRKNQKNVDLAVGIVAHPDRDEMATELGKSLSAEVASFDTRALGKTTDMACAINHIVVLDWLLHAASWIVVLEDDAVPVKDFRFHVKQAVTHAPSPFVSFYLGTGNAVSETQQQIRRAVGIARDNGDAWIVGDCLIGSVGYAVRGDVAEDMVEFIDSRAGRGEELPLRISRWAQDRGHPVAYTMPSLVDHDDGESIGRPYRSDFPKRKAWYHGTRDNWNTKATLLGYCPTWSKPR
jgi:GR25 family glycosyltransferase involved in LPS biosynthesis